MSEIDDLLDQDGENWRAQFDQATPQRPDQVMRAYRPPGLASANDPTVTQTDSDLGRLQDQRPAGLRTEPSSRPTATAGGRRRRGLVASVIAVAAVVIVGGAALVSTIHNRGDEAAHPLRGTVWQIVSYQGDKAVGGAATFYIGKDGSVVVDDACTLFSGTARVDGRSIKIGSPVVRAKGCATRATPSLGQDGVGIITTALTWQVARDRLTLTAANVQIVLRATALPPPTTDIPTLKGAHWKLDSAHDVAGHTVLLGNLRGAALDIDSRNRLTANVGCGKLTAEVTVSTVRGTLSNVRTDGGRCSTPPSEFVANVLQHAANGFDQTVTGTGLAFSVKDTSGTQVEGGTLHYTWAPEHATATDPAVLYNKRWKLVSAGTAKATYPTTFELDSDNSFSAKGKCSGVSGIPVPGEGSALVVGRGTLLFHAFPLASGYGRVCRITAGAPNMSGLGSQLWAIRDGRLILVPSTGSQGEALVFEQLPTPPPSSRLAGSRWVLAALTRNGKFQPRIGHGTLRLDFGPGGKITFDDGTNAHSADVTVRSTSITFGPVGSTYVLCGQGAICAQADIVNQTLSGQVSWVIKDGHLRISRFGRLLLDYAPAK